MKITLTILLALVFVSCKNSTQVEVKKNTIQPRETTFEEKKQALVDEPIEVESKNDFEILLTSNYRDWEGKNPVNNLTKNWVDLYEKNGKYYLGKADFTIERGYDECSGDSTKTVTSKNKTLILIESSNLKLGEINALKFNKNKIWTKEKMSFNYNNIDYSVRAEGDIISTNKVLTDEGEEISHVVKNYKLYISTKNTSEMLFLEEKSFNDTFVELLFIGDIDKDGKLDFIFDASRDYEEKRVVLYLSSKAKEGEIIKKVSEIAIQFDC
jgi:hypothetical protein